MERGTYPSELAPQATMRRATRLKLMSFIWLVGGGVRDLFTKSTMMSLNSEEISPSCWSYSANWFDFHTTIRRASANQLDCPPVFGPPFIDDRSFPVCGLLSFCLAWHDSQTPHHPSCCLLTILRISLARRKNSGGADNNRHWIVTGWFRSNQYQIIHQSIVYEWKLGFESTWSARLSI